MENYVAVEFALQEEESENLIGLLSMYSFESIEEHPFKYIAYIKEQDWSAELYNELDLRTSAFCSNISTKVIVPQNWNEVWESSFEPIKIGDFCVVRANFHPKDLKVKHDIIINPKMAFGTGHHETTYQMIEAMSKLDFMSKSVFDFGTGTGILAILSEKLGAKSIIAIDIEEEAIKNCFENAGLNETTRTEYLLGEPDIVNGQFDIILANVNRSAILSNLDRLKALSKSNTIILFSGLLEEDEGLIRKEFEAKNLTIGTQKQKGEWLCLKTHFTSL